MITIAAKNTGMAFYYALMLPLLHPVALPAFTPMRVIHESHHIHMIRWYTSGFL